jgi:hypothetical protein
LYSPPFYWTNLPQSNLELTFGVELEMVFAYLREPKKGYEFLLGGKKRDDASNPEDRSKWQADQPDNQWMSFEPEASGSQNGIDGTSLDIHMRILKEHGLECHQWHKSAQCPTWTITGYALVEGACKERPLTCA